MGHFPNPDLSLALDKIESLVILLDYLHEVGDADTQKKTSNAEGYVLGTILETCVEARQLSKAVWKPQVAA